MQLLLFSVLIAALQAHFLLYPLMHVLSIANAGDVESICKSLVIFLCITLVSGMMVSAMNLLDFQ
jgi:hypothetical protein